jgi:hypothetical protein
MGEKVTTFPNLVTHKIDRASILARVACCLVTVLGKMNFVLRHRLSILGVAI